MGPVGDFLDIGVSKNRGGKTPQNGWFFKVENLIEMG